MTIGQIENNSKGSLKTQEIDFKDLKVIKPIGQSKFTVFLAQSRVNKIKYALKVFPFYKNKVHPGYITESRFTCLQHPNIVNISACSSKQQIMTRPDQSTLVSLVLMELAPHSDFFEFLLTKKVQLSEMLARTYFHQLIQGVEYMHSQGVAHRDLKLENLLVGENYQLKIADFDTACSLNNLECSSKSNFGTFCYRAPEVIQKTCTNYTAADVYSCGVLLFLLKTAGALPQCEDQLYNDINLLDLLNNDKPAFWEKHCEIQNKEQEFFGADFKELFQGMTEGDVNKRFTIEDIKASKWYQREVYSNEQLASIIRGKLE